MGGGNSHQRALERAKKKHLEGTVGQEAANMQSHLVIDSGNNAPTGPLREWKQQLNRADSIGLLGILVGTIFVLIVPTVWYKVTAFALVCFGFGYFTWLSHWTYRIRGIWKVGIIVGIVVLLGVGALPQFVAQWRMEHIRSELKFNASIPGIAYPDGDHFGIKWSKSFVEVRLSVTSEEKFPIQNLDLSVWPINQPVALAGMAQTDSEPQGCVVRRPREHMRFPSVILRGQDGGRADVSPYMNDRMNEIWLIRDHYDLLCQRILAGESIPLVMAGLPSNGQEGATIASSQLHIKGDYETTAAEGSKRVSVDEIVSISTLPRWK
jgi:hypothetical protein